MTPAAHTRASPKSTLPLPARELDDRSRRAREEAMAVTAFGTTVYEVATESGNTYLVDLRAGRCTCPDHTIRDARCKHLRRVAIEITSGLVAPPHHVSAACAVCDEETFVHRDADAPHRCDRHRLRPGDRVRDRETDTLLVVVDVSDRRADEVRIPEADTTVAAYETNARYPADDPVVAAVYPESVRLTADGPTRDSLRVYSFPQSRLRVVE